MSQTSPAADQQPQKQHRESLYASRAKAYPRFLNSGLFRRLKWLASVLTLAVFWIGPWLRWDRGLGAPHQAIFIDLPGRRAYFFFIEIWPQEVYYLTGLLIIAALFLFFMSAMLGRVWCGFACWQTVFTDLFVWIERLFQGERNARMQLDRAPMSVSKLLRKTATFASWAVIAMAFGFGFTLYFDNAPTLVHNFFTGQAGLMQYVTMGVLSFFCFLLAGFARENVCIYMCPYARFQAAMFDEHSMIVSYEAWRGEPRGVVRGGIQGRDPKEVFQDRGHCVDCKMCIQACPTGIDIRDGLQYECIGCAACIDGCNQVMARMGYPKGLIRYTTENALQQNLTPRQIVVRALRPRVMIYTAILCAIVFAIGISLYTREPLKVDVIRDRASLSRDVDGRWVENVYQLQIMNTQEVPHRFIIHASGAETLQVADTQAVEIPGASTRMVPVRLRIEKGRLPVGSHKIEFEVTAADNSAIVARERSIFLVR